MSDNTPNPYDLAGMRKEAARRKRQLLLKLERKQAASCKVLSLDQRAALISANQSDDFVQDEHSLTIMDVKGILRESQGEPATSKEPTPVRFCPECRVDLNEYDHRLDCSRGGSR